MTALGPDLVVLDARTGVVLGGRPTRAVKARGRDRKRIIAWWYLPDEAPADAERARSVSLREPLPSLGELRAMSGAAVAAGLEPAGLDVLFEAARREGRIP